MLEETLILLQIIFIDIILAADNAIIIGLIASNFVPKNRKLIIFWGVVGALVFKVIFAVFATYLFKFYWIKILGGLLLVWIVNDLRKDLFEIKKIKSVLNNCGIIYFRNQNLSSSNYLNFAKKLGIPADYPRLKGLNPRYSKITVVERKATDKGPSFGEQFHTDSIYTKKPPRFTMLLSKLVPRKGQANTEFSSQYLAYKNLPHNIKKK